MERGRARLEYGYVDVEDGQSMHPVSRALRGVRHFPIMLNLEEGWCTRIARQPR